ncbi:hypothetical protein ACFSO7_10865 [Bacillus sp. CGMCC 1.16607]|uniref:hypothetical protein n=1 Tax=Bacillus sp. CGMCC 1.16607 TaxID=3351842 RepID=UPI00363635FB
MILNKVSGACLIFFLLFAGAWKLENSNVSPIPLKQGGVTEVLPLSNIHVPINQNTFQPREYVRITEVFLGNNE